MLTIYSATTAAIGGAWELDGSFFEDCTRPDGTAGTEYIRQVGAQGVVDPKALADKVRQLWLTDGYTGTTVSTDPTGDPVVNFPKTRDREYLRLSINTLGATLEGSSACVATSRAS